jgi:hypothetical protein
MIPRETLRKHALKGNTMNTPSKSLSVPLALAIAAALAASTLSSEAQSASATISDVPAGGGMFDYTVTLKNTGTTNLSGFWYGWTTSGNNLPSNPSSPGNTLGWANTLDGNSIQWSVSGLGLAPGQSGTFTFVSSSTPTAITTLPSGESVAYVHGIDFSQGIAGDSTPVFSPSLVATPEPSSLGMLAAGLFVIAGSFRSLAASRKLR